MPVIDASVAIKWFKDEPNSDRVRSLLGSDMLIAPELLVTGLCNAAWKAFRRKMMTAEQAEAVPTAVKRVFRRLQPMLPPTPRATALARDLDHPVYDCFYLVLAEREGEALITADQRLLTRLAGAPWNDIVHDLASFAARS
jgi:predicted nucleic acid-binding protein